MHFQNERIFSAFAKNVFLQVEENWHIFFHLWILKIYYLDSFENSHYKICAYLTMSNPGFFPDQIFMTKTVRPLFLLFSNI